ncbi:peroxiredoxin family protein [Chitinolyticbacter meiyuanensis]|uniref:peroxiredoxin family protein n=1 Tax=Chitinolyticbacter meiyuanensis TaxID=682798 RepID=UPI0011E5E69D|nr:TlpA disulfide reductase family protein [Chitinolyticbacter meiyuanensis]
MQRFFIRSAFIVFLTVVVFFIFLEREQQAPQISWTNLEGKKQSLQELRGQVVLVNFWATTCTGCIAEMPKLIKIQNEFAKDGYQTVAVAMQYDNPEQIRKYIAQQALPFNVTHDRNNDISRAFGEVQLTPTSYLIGKKGTIVRKYIGEPEFKEFRETVQKELLKY